MLDARWKKVARALRVYALSALVGLVAIAAIVALAAALSEPTARGTSLVGVAILAVDGVALLAFLASTAAIAVYASVPAESGARGWAIVAAVAALLQVPVAGASLVATVAGMDAALIAIAQRLEPLLAYIVLLAMAKSLRNVASFIRADELYGRASMLSTGLTLLLLFPLASMCFALANPIYRGSSDELVFLAFGLGLVTAFFSVLLGISYVVLVFQAGRAVDDAIYE